MIDTEETNNAHHRMSERAGGGDSRGTIGGHADVAGLELDQADVAGLELDHTDRTGASGHAERGQLIVLTAVVVAVVFVALAIIVNSAIFSANLATRDTGQSDDAIIYMDSAHDAVFGAIRHTNDIANNTTIEALSTYQLAIDAWTRTTRDRAAKRGAATDLTTVAHPGWRLEQDTDRSFTPANDTNATEWQVAGLVGNVGAVRLNVTRNSLYDAAADYDNTSEEAFRVRVDNGTHEWQVYVFRDTTNNTIVTHVGDPDSFGSLGVLLGEPDTCSRVESRAAIDLRNATFAGTACDSLAFAGNLTGRVDVHYEHVRESPSGDFRVTGQYTLVVNESHTVETGSDDLPDQFNNASAAAPTARAIIYSVSYDVRFERTTAMVDRSGRMLPREEAYVG